MNSTLTKLIHFADEDVKQILHAFWFSVHNELDLMWWYTLYIDALNYAENIDLMFNTSYKQWIKNARDSLNAHYHYESDDDFLPTNDEL